MSDKMISFELLRTTHLWSVILVGVVLYAYTRIRKSRPEKTFQQPRPSTKDKVARNPEDAYYQIEPFTEPDLQKIEPLKIRPFKPKYHLTMSLENTTLSDLIAMDNTYRSRISLRRQLLRDNHDDVLRLNTVAEPAVTEFYTWLVKTYLPRRHPTLFTLSDSGLQNHITAETLPLHPPSPSEALRLIGSHIDTDFLFLLPTPTPNPPPVTTPIPSSAPSLDPSTPKYHLSAFITCFPSGFSTSQKLGLQLSDIHAPVPGYAQKLERSMDRFFANLPVGKIVRRCNWTVTTHRELFCLAGNHFVWAGEEGGIGGGEDGVEGGGLGLSLEDKVHKEQQDVNIQNCALRCERQTLHRLPETKALVFAFKTYLYGLDEVRDEGSGEEMAEAIDGMGMGNVPEMRVYKRQVVWGETVKAYLRGEG